MSPEFKFGKKILNTLTTGMYKNAMFIYREYIQNAADSIDDAIKLGLPCPEGFQIHVSIDSKNRTISIEDTATGIPQSKVVEILGNIGDSEKDPAEKKGFIGIGRLGGLGYCQKVVFETSFLGENVKTISEWNAFKIREIIHDRSIKDDAQSVLHKTVVFRTEPCEKKSHFFKVILLGIPEENDDLLDADKVYQYLQMVAPAEFDFTNFPHKKTIQRFIEANHLPKLNEYQIFLNRKKVTKGYQSTLKIAGQKNFVEIRDIQPGLIKCDGEVVAWYWYGITDFSGTMERFWQSGLRLRKGNIQIGEEDCLYQHKMWRERRGNFYFFGEVHALDANLIPNGRRDYFEEDSYCRRFERALSDIFGKMLDIVYAASNVRCATAKVVNIKSEIKEVQGKIREGRFDSKQSQKAAFDKLDHLNNQFKVAVGDLEKTKNKWDSKKEDEVVGVAVKSIIEDISVSSRPVKPLEMPKVVQTEFVVDKLTQGEKKVLDLVKSVLKTKLPQVDFDGIWDEILKKMKAL